MLDFADSANMDLGSLQTHWSEIERARSSEMVRNQVVVRYMDRIARRIERKWKTRLKSDVSDVIQGFLAKMLEGKFLDSARRDRGRFRGFLNRSIDHHVIDTLRTMRPETCDLDKFPPSADPEIASEIVWAEEVFREASERLYHKCAETGLDDVWEIAKRRIVEPVLSGITPEPMEKIAEQYALGSENVACGKARTARKWLRQLIRQIFRELRPMCEIEIEEELHELTQALSTRLQLGAEDTNPIVRMYSSMACDLEDFDPCQWKQLIDTSNAKELVGMTFDDLLHMEHPQIGVLSLVKDFAKAEYIHAQKRSDREIAKLLYALVVAVARTRNRVCISRLTPTEMARNLETARCCVELDDRYHCLVEEQVSLLVHPR